VRERESINPLPEKEKGGGGGGKGERRRKEYDVTVYFSNIANKY